MYFGNKDLNGRNKDITVKVQPFKYKQNTKHWTEENKPLKYVFGFFF